MARPGNIILSEFISSAEEKGLPVQILKTVKSDYTVEYGGSGDARTDTTWNNLYLVSTVVQGLTQKSNVMADVQAFNTLYHEATHAYIDITDVDDGPIWDDAARHYSGANLTSGRAVYDEELYNLIDEAAAMYVGSRVANVWAIWRRVELLSQILENFESKIITKSHAYDLIISQRHLGDIPQLYDRGMFRQVFGYVVVNDEQQELRDRRIPRLLQSWCDTYILEWKVYNQFYSMNRLSKQYALLNQRLAKIECSTK